MKSIALQGEIWTLTAEALRIGAIMVFMILAYLLAKDVPLGSHLEQLRALDIFWKIIVPLVPAILLVSPALWRNMCPLAFLNIAGNRVKQLVPLSSKRPKVNPVLSKYGLYIGMILLFLIVPGRLLIFNRNGEVLLLLLLLLAIASFLAGILFPYKSGWCSAICPVYPVEAAYGLNPLILGENTLCRTQTPQGELNCFGCTRHCLDLKVSPGPDKKVASNAEWRPRPALSLFISAFPGFVSAYWLLSTHTELNGPAAIPRCLLVYFCFFVLMLLSAATYKLLRLVLSLRQVGVKRLDLAYVALAFNIYYWMSIPGFVSTVGALLDITADWYQDTITFGATASLTLLSAAWMRRNW